MKETVKSLKLYFILSGILGLVGSTGLLALASTSPISAIFGIIGIAFAVGYFYVGVSLQKMLVTSPPTVSNLLYASIAYQVINFLIGLTGGFQPSAAGILAFSLLITGYLLVNVKRLAGEEKIRIQQDIS